jgi:flavin reductase (DIM6/NTAB) family NADH-FMN oxidoreductase RutF
MSKTTIGPQTPRYPNPTVLVGSNVNGKPNFAAVAWTGTVNGDPPTISIALQHKRYTLKGIRQNMAFSVNIPSVDIIKETDYCGIVSGSQSDKARDCHFQVFYGSLDSAPLIEQCPVNHECEVLHILNLGSHALIIGRIKETHVSDDCLTDGKPDVMKIKPFFFASGKYYATGEFIADAFSIGEELKG